MAAPKKSNHTERVVATLLESVPSARFANTAETALSAMAASQRELMSFVQMRLEKDGEAIREIMGCRNWVDVLQVQARWIQETIQDYSVEGAKMLAIYGEHDIDASKETRRRS